MDEKEDKEGEDKDEESAISMTINKKKRYLMYPTLLQCNKIKDPDPKIFFQKVTSGIVPFPSFIEIQ